MRRTYRRPYELPAQLQPKQKRKQDSNKQPLVQPEWDSTIHDLSALKASPEDVLRRKVSRTSRNQAGHNLVALMPQAARSSANSGQQARYTPSASDGSSCSDEDAQQQLDEDSMPGHQHAAAAGAAAHSSWHQRQHTRQQQQQQAPGSASVLAQYACPASDSDSEEDEDVCCWQSPVKPHMTQQQRWEQQQQQQQRHVLQDIRNRQHSSTSWQQRPQHQPASGRLSVEADMLQSLLDKVTQLEQQLQAKHDAEQPQPLLSTPGLQQQLAQSQQQLAATQQELHKLQGEHRQYVAHTSTLLTQLQTQVQQLIMGQPQLPLLPQRSTSRLQPAPLRANTSAAAAAAAGGGLTTATNDGGGSSSDSLLRISSFIQQQLQQHEALTQRQGLSVGTAAAPRTSAAALRASAASHHSNSSGAAGPGQRGMLNTTSAAASSGLGGSSAPGSPARRKADTRFTPAVTDAVQLPSYAAAMARQQQGGGRAGGVAHNSSRSSSSWQAAAGAVGSPTRLHATQVPRPGPSDQPTQLQPVRVFAAAEAATTAAPACVVTPAAAAAAAVWEAESPSPRPDMMAVPQERAHCHLSNVSAESVLQRRMPAAAGGSAAAGGGGPAHSTHEVTAAGAPASASQQLSSDLAALLRDLGLASLELQQQGSEGQRGDLSGALPQAEAAGAGTAAAAAAARAAGARTGSVLSESAAGPAAQTTAPQLLSYSRGDGVLTGVYDVDRGLQGGLQHTSSVFTAAGRLNVEGAGSGDHRKSPAVPAPGLRDNMCFRDHLKAAAVAAAQK